MKKRLVLIWLLSALVSLGLAVPVQETSERKKPKPSCGYKSCPKGKDGMINVHLVPHTHDDVGWLKTVDQYYYGVDPLTQKAGVQYILDSVVQELLHDPNKRFVYVETAYLWKWWKEQHDSLRHKVKRLVTSGQLEIIGGGWSMNDEAVTHYQSIIDQFSWGFRKLNETFGECGRPRVGWQIDPFGHSREMASLFAQMGFDGLFIGRLDYQDKRLRLGTKQAELLWEGSANLGKNSQLFTSILYNNYAPPPGFCFDIVCADQPIVDNKHSPEYNVDQKVKSFIKYAKTQSSKYSTKNIIMTMGEDFNYQEASLWYTNLDKLIWYVNEEQKNGSMINAFYSTPSCYLKAVHDSNQSWSTKQDDFFPYASDPHAYWTGYFTSRPTLKRFERVGNNMLQVCKQLHALAELGPEDRVDLDRLREAMGIMQHHDAITGTEKQAVAEDYARILSEGIAECGVVADAALNKLMSQPEDTDDVQPQFSSCLLLNMSQCEVSEKSSQFVVTVYNPLSRPVTHFVRLPVTGAAYTVVDPKGKKLVTQMLPIPEEVLAIPGRKSDATSELVFEAQLLPPLGFKTYYISRVNHIVQDDESFEETYSTSSEEEQEHITISNKRLRIVIDGKTGLLKEFSKDGVNITMKQAYYYYEAMAGNNRGYKNRSSGAYIFRPNGSEPYPVVAGGKPKAYKGPLVEEVHQTINQWVSQVIRVYRNTEHVEIEWLVGPIPVKDRVGKEVITRYSTNMNTSGVFYTDSNGRELLKRVRNYRPTWKLQVSEPVSGNYYPVTNRIVMVDENSGMEVAVVTDRAEGGTSLTDGELELMLHRRLLHDDAFGVGEALNERAFGQGLVARGRHYIIGGLSKPKTGSVSLAAQERQLAQEKILAPWVFLSPSEGLSARKWAAAHRTEFSGLKQSLPSNVQILTLEPWRKKSYLLRLEHIMEKNDDEQLSKNVTVNLKDSFAPFTIISAEETTLGGNQWLSKAQRLTWKVDSNNVESVESNAETKVYVDDPLTVTLCPMQIRTFVIETNNSEM